MIKDKILLTCDNVDNFADEVIDLLKATKGGHSIRFADGEASVEITHKLNRELAIVLQSVTSDKSLMSLLIMIDALRNYGIKKIVGVITYFGYARQDRKISPCSPVSAKLVARFLEEAGLTDLITIDLHNEFIEGFFNISTTNLLPTKLFVQDIMVRHKKEDLSNIVIVAPDTGATKRARIFASYLGQNHIIIINKHRERAGISEVMNIIGNVEGKHCIITDDIVDSAGTLCNASLALKNQGAKFVEAYITHGVLAGRATNPKALKAISRINESALKQLTITNSMNYKNGNTISYYSDTNTKVFCNKIRTISLSQMIAREVNKHYKQK